MSQSLSKLIFETQRLLSAKIGSRFPFYKQTACLNEEIALYIAYCEIIKIFFPNKKRLIKFIDEKLVPALEKIGIATWSRSEITDLGLKVGLELETVSLKYLDRKAMEDAESGSGN